MKCTRTRRCCRSHRWRARECGRWLRPSPATCIRSTICGCFEYLEHDLHHDKTVRDTWYRHWVQVGFEALERWLTRDAATGRFCHGDAPTLADVCLVPQVANARRFAVDMTAYPCIVRIDAACRAMAEFQSSGTGTAGLSGA